MSILFNNGQGYGINPTNNFIPVNRNGNFSDSIFSVGATNTNAQAIYLGVPNGFRIDFTNKLYKLGEFTGTAGNGSQFIIDDANKNIYTQTAGFGFGFLQSDKNSVTLGDWSNALNQTFFKVDDQNQRVEFSTNLRSATAGVAALQYLKVRVAGVDYKIALLNP